jgi:hypothetical protein
MNIEFHYYLIYILGKYSGLDELDCITTAYSSQYVDNNLVAQMIIADGRRIPTIVTHNYGWWSDWFPRNVYIPFHFFPGDPASYGARRKDGRTNRLNCTPAGPLVTELLDRALASSDFYRIGIALHSYADSWAHQNFSGSNDDWNGLGQDIPVPKVGHAEALSQPDKITGRWMDNRLQGEYVFIDNLTRFLDAARHIYEKLCGFTGKKPHGWELLRDRIKTLIGPYDESDSRQKERILGYIVEEELLEYNKYDWLRDAVVTNDNEQILEDAFKHYDKFSWLKDQVLYKTGVFKKPPLQARSGFFESNYFRWQAAAKNHLQTANEILSSILP